MLAAPIRIHARFEADIRAVIARDNRLRAIAKILSRAARPFFRFRRINIDIAKIDMQLLETVGRTPGRAPAMNRSRTLWRLFNDLSELLHHVISSHEHICRSSMISVAAVY